MLRPSPLIEEIQQELHMINTHNILDENLFIALSFLLLLYIVYNTVKKSVKSFIDNEIAKIRSKIDHAHHVQQESFNLLQETKNQLDAINSTKEELIQEYEQAIKAQFELQQDNFRKELKSQKLDALDAIARKERAILLNIQKEIAQTSEKLCIAYFQNINDPEISDFKIFDNLSKESRNHLISSSTIN